MILTVEVAYCVYDDAVIGSWLCVTRITLCMLLLVSCVRRWTGVAKTVSKIPFKKCSLIV